MPDNAQESKAYVVLADVNVGDVSVEETENGISGSFSLRGKMGQQNGITYGIVVRDDRNRIQDFVSLGRNETVLEGETKTLSFAYEYPKYLTGEVSIYIVAETERGLSLGL